MRILFVSPRQCWPPRSGAKLRDYHLARALGLRAELSYVYYADAAAAPLTTREMPFCGNIYPVPRPRGYSPGRLIRGLAGPLPLTVLNYHSKPMERTLARVLETGPFDAIHLDATHLAAYAPALRRICAGARIVFDWHNIESELLLRYAENATSRLQRQYAKATARRMASLEADLLRSSAAHIVCSAREQADLRKIAPDSRIAVIENGVDAGAFRDRPIAVRGRVLFVGLMAYHANIDAAVWFARQIWPHIRRTHPELRLTILGANPTREVLELSAEPGVDVTGTVPDVRPYYDEAFAVVAPLRTGAGTRLKILEAMAAGVPVISTRLGAEGLEVVPGNDLLIAEGAGDWSAGFDSLMQTGKWNALATAARRLVETRYDWSIIGQSLYDTYVSWLARPQ